MNVRDPVLAVRCPAKVNLALRVLRRRPDGYHELDTVFQAIGLWDELSLAPASQLSLSCSDPRLPEDESNLVLRAARLLRERHGAPGWSTSSGSGIPSSEGPAGSFSTTSTGMTAEASFPPHVA